MNRRRGITAIVGPNGSGKTLCAVACHAAPSLRQGRPVYATFRIDHQLAHQITDWRQILDLRNCTLIVDEVSTIFPSRESHSLPAELVRILHQLRKPDVDLVWMAVNWSRADKVLREATQRVTVSRSHLADKWQRTTELPDRWRLNRNIATDHEGNKLTRNETWNSNRLFRWTTYNADAFDEYTIHAVKKLKPVERTWYWRPWHRHDEMYDTAEEVNLMNNLTETGVCLTCGGYRRRPPCICGAPRHPRRAPRAEGPAEVTA